MKTNQTFSHSLGQASSSEQIKGKISFALGSTRIRDKRVVVRDENLRRLRNPAQLVFDVWAKRSLDIVVAVALLILLAPLLLAVAVAIKSTSPGPVIFRQKRYGIGRSEFEILKFRTMFWKSCDTTGVQQARHGDVRVTPVGRFLRTTSLDELPQLINVLRGDMSLVGPRPHVPGMLAAGMLYEELVPEYFGRLNVRPGVTGLAQVNGWRGSTEDPLAAQARIADDLLYVEHWSLALDLKIILMTAWTEFLSGTGV